MYVSNDGTSVYIDTITTITPREWQEIKEIEIIGATTSFKVGDKPVFTGKVPENAPYIYQCERWENGTSGITSADFWNTTDSWDEVITSFEKGRTFYYGLYFKADIGYYFSRNTKLKVNGQYVNYTVDYFMHDDPDRMDTYWIKTDLAMTPTETTVTDDTNKDTTGGTANPTTTVTDNKNTGTVTTAPATTAQTKTKTTAKTSPKAATTPKTGDNNLMIMWFAIMSASAACLAAHSVRRRHRAGR